jgi:hypothetical protein
VFRRRKLRHRHYLRRDLDRLSNPRKMKYCELMSRGQRVRAMAPSRPRKPVGNTCPRPVSHSHRSSGMDCISPPSTLGSGDLAPSITGMLAHEPEEPGKPHPQVSNYTSQMISSGPVGPSRARLFRPLQHREIAQLPDERPPATDGPPDPSLKERVIPRNSAL